MRKWLTALAEGKAIGTVAVVESAGSIDPRDINAIATKSGGGWHLNGIKMFVPYANVADFIVVAAKHDSDIRLFVVDTKSAGVTIRSLKNLDLTRRVSSVELKNAPAERLHGGGTDLFAKLIDVAAVAIAADSLGGTERALEMAVDYSKVREQFGKPIGSFQALKHAAAEIVADLEPARAMLWYAAYALDTGAADAVARRRDGEGAPVRYLQPRHRSRGPDARRNRLHLGARHASVVQARALQRIVLRLAVVPSRARRRPGRLLRRRSVKFDIFYQLPEAANQITTERYRELIAEAAEADRLGFNTVWLAEVHFAPRFSVMPTPLLLLAAIAERTTNIRLGMAVNLMPLHHPIRLAEEVATLDVLSGGRVEFGAGRGAFPLNYRGYGVEMADSRAAVRRRPRINQDCMDATQRVDGIEVVPKPIQRPHPPIRLAANSADTFTFAGANRYPIFAGGPVNPIPVLAERLKIYETALKDAGHERPDDWLAAALMVFVGRDRAQVRATIEPSLRNYFDAVSEIIEPESLAAGASSGIPEGPRPAAHDRLLDRRFDHGDFRRPRILHRPNRATETAIRFLAPGVLVRNRRHQRASERARSDAPVRGSRDAKFQ